jgi:hypothetical protein
MSLKLIRKTPDGDVQLDGTPIFIAGSVTSKNQLPISGIDVGEAFFVDTESLCVWNGTQWTTLSTSGTSSNCKVCTPMTEQEVEDLVNEIITNVFNKWTNS